MMYRRGNLLLTCEVPYRLSGKVILFQSFILPLSSKGVVPHSSSVSRGRKIIIKNETDSVNCRLQVCTFCREALDKVTLGRWLISTKPSLIISYLIYYGHKLAACNCTLSGRSVMVGREPPPPANTSSNSYPRTSSDCESDSIHWSQFPVLPPTDFLSV